jgi:hypothetical protein
MARSLLFDQLIEMMSFLGVLDLPGHLNLPEHKEDGLLLQFILAAYYLTWLILCELDRLG